MNVLVESTESGIRVSYGDHCVEIREGADAEAMRCAATLLVEAVAGFGTSDVAIAIGHHFIKEPAA